MISHRRLDEQRRALAVETMRRRLADGDLNDAVAAWFGLWRAGERSLLAQTVVDALISQRPADPVRSVIVHHALGSLRGAGDVELAQFARAQRSPLAEIVRGDGDPRQRAGAAALLVFALGRDEPERAEALAALRTLADGENALHVAVQLIESLHAARVIDAPP